MSFQITRTLDAPREIVFSAWTEAEQLGRWFGPKGCVLDVLRFELEPGGVFHYRMRFPDGNSMCGRFTFEEIATPGLLVYRSGFANEEGDLVRAPFDARFPLEVRNTLTLLEENGRTEMKLVGEPVDATEDERAFFAQMNASMNAGFSGTFDQLLAHLEVSRREFSLRRVYDAPLARVFTALTDPAALACWWGPRDCSITTQHADIREGGEWRFVMHTPFGDFDNRLRYTLVDPSGRLEYSVDDGEGNGGFQGFITLREQDGRTHLELRGRFDSADALHKVVNAVDALELGKTTLEKLALQLELGTSRFFIDEANAKAEIRRVFDAPRDLVWDAVTQPEHLRRWYGPRSTKVIACEIDLRVGGSWRCVMTSEHGEQAFHGEFRVVEPKTRIEQTWIWGGMPDVATIEDMHLEQYDRYTTLTVYARYPSREVTQGIVSSGMQQGATESHDRLAELLEQLAGA